MKGISISHDHVVRMDSGLGLELHPNNLTSVGRFSLSQDPMNSRVNVVLRLHVIGHGPDLPFKQLHKQRSSPSRPISTPTSTHTMAGDTPAKRAHEDGGLPHDDQPPAKRTA